ncbi:MAG TPA: chorismate lyase [Sulfurivirga caldicuralii]|nr:chorismate lyase [Sulfurivirga caldicuralii]
MNWQPAPPPPELSEWIQAEDSLTQRLRRYFGEVAVEILRETPACATDYERSATGTTTGWVREVILRAQTNGQPLLWARTFIPALDKDNPWVPLTKIGAKPLGEVLFTLQDAHRGPIYSGQFRGLKNFRGTPYWGRWRSWRRQGYMMILTEVFLFHGRST